jgi:hypothetical protein
MEQQPGAASRRTFLAAAAGGVFTVASGLSASRAQAASATPVARGIDYAWTQPRPSAIRSAGYTFACRYLSDNKRKNLTAAEAQSLSAAGIDIVANWEYAPDEALNGYGEGVRNAQKALRQALECGMPADRPIYFSVDFKAEPADRTAVVAYFDGVASVLGVGRTGAYGGFPVIQWLFDAGKIAWGWQTYAWSGRQWDSRAQLRQVLNNIYVDGAECDRDEAWAADFGQWSYGSAGPRTLNHLAFVKTRNTNGTIEVRQTPDPFTAFDMQSSTGLSVAESSLGFFSLAADKLVYVKTRNTGSGKVELRWRTAASGFTTGYSTATYFGLEDAGTGIFSLAGSELFFIKTADTDSGMVEVHKLSSANDFQNPPVLSARTPLSVADAVNGSFHFHGRDLVFIKSRATGSGSVEVHILDGLSKYAQWKQNAVTLFDQAEDGSGVFRYGDVHGDGAGDLVFIKTKNIDGATVELYATSSSTGYSELSLATSTAFALGDEDNGWWGMN